MQILLIRACTKTLSGKECRKRGKMNHFQSKYNRKKYVRSTAVCVNKYNVGTLSVFGVGNKRRAMVTLNLGDSSVPVPFLIDSGSECCHVRST